MHRFLILIFPLISIAQTVDKAAKIGYESINTSDILKHITILTSDSLEGRETTFPGQKKAATYIADVFKSLELKAIGDNGSYYQHFDVEVTHVNPETKIIANIGRDKKYYTWGNDFFDFDIFDTLVSGSIAFVGFNDTELDSVAQSKLVGRVVFVFAGYRESFINDTTNSNIMRRLSVSRRDAGAIATLVIPDLEGAVTFEHIQQMRANYNFNIGSMQLKGKAPQVRVQPIRLIISPNIAEEVLKPSGLSLQQIRNQAKQNNSFKPIFIDDVILTIDAKLIHETKQTENIVGLLQGSDPDLKAQVVAFTAHYDHLGKGVDGTLYPGADDDGSGTVTVMEIAKAFARNPIKPKRSLLFITFVGEEKRLLGSQYYVDNPLIPLDQTIADLNLDMIGRIDTIHETNKDTNYIYIIGSDKISFELDSLLQIANKESDQLTLDYKYNDEYDPEQYYRRSDHYNFAKNGVPIVFFFDGSHADYHKPTDTVDKILFDRMVNITRLIYYLGWKVGNFEHLLIKKKN